MKVQSRVIGDPLRPMKFRHPWEWLEILHVSSTSDIYSRVCEKAIETGEEWFSQFVRARLWSKLVYL